jgi:pimeloyl-ACP methyl ester carboxylesterase
MTMATVVSADTTLIGKESVGAGPPLLLVHGSTGTGARWSSLRAPPFLALNPADI